MKAKADQGRDTTESRMPLGAATGQTEPAPEQIPHLTVAEVLSRWPDTVAVFVRHHLACAGCTMATFEHLGDVAHIYGLNPERFLLEVRQVAVAAEAAQKAHKAQKARRS